MNQKRIVPNTGYVMPAEWHKHTSTWLAWPNNPETWPEDIDQVELAFIQAIQAITRGENVNLLVDDKDAAYEVHTKLRHHNVDMDYVNMYEIPTVDVWIRDYGPNFVLHPQGQGLAYNRWKFNAWGNKYEDLARDHFVLDQLQQYLGVMMFEPGLVLEGGSIDVNGEGICLTTQQCLLNPNRNPGFDQEILEAYLKGFLGVQKVIWLGHGIEGDDTDGHVDDIARFVGKNTIVAAVENNLNDANHAPLSANWIQLENESNLEGTPFDVVELPMPKPLYHEGNRIPASYANFYICNHAVLVPTFDDANDQVALTTLQKLFPLREVIGIPCQVMVRGFGSLHCASQQEPSA